MDTLSRTLQLLASDQNHLRSFLRDTTQWISSLPDPLPEEQVRELHAISADCWRFLERECRIAFDERGERAFASGNDLARRRFLVRASSMALALPFAKFFTQERRTEKQVAAIPEGPAVIDTESCEDKGCTNISSCGDSDLCSDQLCDNSVGSCDDDTGCQDSGCTNHFRCNDDNVCGDNDCTNQNECKDFTCTDTPNCDNAGSNGCSDGDCRDTTCANVQTCFDGSACKDNIVCTNNSVCTDTQCSDSGCSNVVSCGDTKTCINDPC